MNVKQKQCLLAYLNYYTGNIDGIWGSQSRKAAEDFQRAYGGITVDGDPGPETQKAMKQAVANDMFKEACGAGETGSYWDSIQHWSREEFRCQCGGKYCDGFPVEPEEALVRLADDVREHFGRRGYRSSGLRCKTWNAIQGGVSNSRHLTGKALDFRIEGFTAAQVLKYVNAHAGTRYAYDIDGTYVHMDVE